MKKIYSCFILLLITGSTFAAPLPSTDVRFYRPFESQAEGQAPLKTTETLQGTCTKHSALDNRSDAWQCQVATRLLDPCFIKTYIKTKTAICPYSPWQSQSVLIHLNPPLPPITNNKDSLDMSEDDPWAIELVNGGHCLKLDIHNIISAHGQTVKYACDNQGFLLGHIQRCNLRWKMLFLPSRNSNSSKTVEISKAWY